MDVKLIELQSHGDERGSLVALEEFINIPFTIKRVYYMFDTQKTVSRGFHAHKHLKQLAIVLKGSCRLKLDNGQEKVVVYLDNPSQGLYLDSCVWREIYDFSDDCVLVVLSDALYDESDYVRNYDEFVRMIKNDS